MAAQTTHWTADLARALPDDGNRYEVLDGELLVTPAPSKPHQRAVKELLLPLEPYVRSNAIGETWFSPADLEFRPRRWLQPDLFVASLVDGQRTMDNTIMPRRLLLTVEVLSPATRRADRVNKRIAYLEEGVPEHWMVDLDARIIERWRQGEERPEILGDTLTWQPNAGVPAFSLDLPHLFADILD